MANADRAQLVAALRSGRATLVGAIIDADTVRLLDPVVRFWNGGQPATLPWSMMREALVDLLAEADPSGRIIVPPGPQVGSEDGVPTVAVIDRALAERADRYVRQYGGTLATLVDEALRFRLGAGPPRDRIGS